MSYSPGLKDVVATETRLSSVDGEAGELVIAGYPLEEIAERATYEELVYLLWHGTLPGPAAHCIEQRAVDRIFRPDSRYTGKNTRRWIPVEDR